MKIPGEKPKNLLDLISNNNEAVKISTRSSNLSVGTVATDSSDRLQSYNPTSEAAEGRATSIKLGLAKHIAEEFDSKKVSDERQSKIASIKARIENGSYLTSISSESIAEKLLEDSRLESLIFRDVANNE